MICYAKIENAEVANILVAGEEYREEGCVRVPEELGVVIGDGYDGSHFTRNGQPLKTELEQAEEAMGIISGEVSIDDDEA